MEKRAVEVARTHDDHAAKSLADMKAANDFPTVERHWTAFLSAAARVFNKLEQGAKTSGQSNAWFGRKHRERKTGPLLRYVWHARNADEHTLEQITELNPGRADLVTPTAREVAALRETLRDEKRPHAVLGLIEVVFPHVVLRSVTDRMVRYDPPDSHLGKSLADKSPARVGDLELTYLDAMIGEAAQLSAAPGAE